MGWAVLALGLLAAGCAVTKSASMSKFTMVSPIVPPAVEVIAAAITRSHCQDGMGLIELFIGSPRPVNASIAVKKILRDVPSANVVVNAHVWNARAGGGMCVYVVGDAARFVAP